MRIAFYPGCSVHSTAREYQESLDLVCKRLDISLQPVDDWNCCGATPAHGIDHVLAIGLAARNLGQVEKMGMDQVVTPCAACYSRLKTAAHELAHSEKVRGELAQRTGGPLPGNVDVMHVLELMAHHVGLDRIAAEVKRPLSGMKLAAYYGCLLARPREVTQFDDPEQPTIMDNLLKALGAETVTWSHKAECCGASFAASQTDIVLDLAGEVLASASQAKAQAVVVACPLCQMNLDTRQKAIEARAGRSYGLPIIFFTQLMGLAFGFAAKALGFQRLLVDPSRRLSEWGFR
jgi:heterodisulfide reductase subunit B2